MKVAGFNWAKAIKSAERSRSRLGRIDLPQLHWPPAYVPSAKPLENLKRWQRRA